MHTAKPFYNLLTHFPLAVDKEASALILGTGTILKALIFGAVDRQFKYQYIWMYVIRKHYLSNILGL